MLPAYQPPQPQTYDRVFEMYGISEILDNSIEDDGAVSLSH